MRYRLRTLLILLAVGPMVLAGAWWGWQISLRESEPQIKLGGVTPRIIVQPEEESTLGIPYTANP